MTGPMRHLARWHAAIDAGAYVAPTLTAVDGTGRHGSSNPPTGTPRRPYGRSSAATRNEGELGEQKPALATRLREAGAVRPGGPRPEARRRGDAIPRHYDSRTSSAATTPLAAR